MNAVKCPCNIQIVQYKSFVVAWGSLGSLPPRLWEDAFLGACKWAWKNRAWGLRGVCRSTFQRQLIKPLFPEGPYTKSYQFSISRLNCRLCKSRETPTFMFSGIREIFILFLDLHNLLICPTIQQQYFDLFFENLHRTEQNNWKCQTNPPNMSEHKANVFSKQVSTLTVHAT